MGESTELLSKRAQCNGVVRTHLLLEPLLEKGMDEFVG